MKVKNTLTQKVEEVVPLEEGKIKLYSCGPTVYNYAHIGNLRAFVFSDVLKRALSLLGFSVFHVMNITDVDDKIIRDSIKEGKTRAQFALFYEKAFLDDLQSLNILPADKLPRATEYIEQMRDIIQELLEKGLAYQGADGSIYYSVHRFDEYGKLAHLDKRKLKAGASGRVKKDEYSKDEAHDFALWKTYEPTDGDVFWDVTFTIDDKEVTIKGRPGWHIECSAMSTALLGESFDIHTGGIDLVFPHHENEIAQSEGASGKQFVKYWLHNEHLLVDGGKMSKSLGNFYTLRDLVDKGYDPLAFRLLMLQAKYSSRLNFTFESLDAATQSLARLNDFARFIVEKSSLSTPPSQPAFIVAANDMLEQAKMSLADDLDTPALLEHLFLFIKTVYTDRDQISGTDAKIILDVLRRIDSVLGVMDFQVEELPPNIKELIEKREEARENKQWDKADELREQIKNLGYIIEDSPSGTRWKRV